MVEVSQCITCKHFIDNKKWGCKAFTQIPEKYVFNKNQHNDIDKKQKGEYIYSPINENNIVEI